MKYLLYGLLAAMVVSPLQAQNINIDRIERLGKENIDLLARTLSDMCATAGKDKSDEERMKIIGECRDSAHNFFTTQSQGFDRMIEQYRAHVKSFGSP